LACSKIASIAAKSITTTDNWQASLSDRIKEQTREHEQARKSHPQLSERDRGRINLTERGSYIPVLPARGVSWWERGVAEAAQINAQQVGQPWQGSQSHQHPQIDSLPQGVRSVPSQQPSVDHVRDSQQRAQVRNGRSNPCTTGRSKDVLDIVFLHFIAKMLISFVLLI